MAIDTETPRSPGWWLVRLNQRLRERRFGGNYTSTQGGYRSWMEKKRRENRPGIDLLADYLRGEPPLPTCSDSWREAMRPFLRMSRLNLAELVISSALERMIPLGWATSAEDDRDGDRVADRVAKVNDFAALFPDVFENMLALGDGYALVGPGPGRDEPLVTAEDPREVITAHDPATGAVIAALKVYRDEWDDTEWAHVYLPGQVFVATRNLRGDSGRGWEWDEERSGPTLDGVIPIVRFRNRRGAGDFEPHIDVLDRINDTIFQRVAVGKYQAFRRLGMINLPGEDADGTEIDYSGVFTADPGAVWQLPADVSIWESGVVDLTGLRMAIKDDATYLAGVCRTPLHYILPDAAQGSAEGASMQRENLVYRVEDRQRRANGPLAQVMSLCFRYMGEGARADSLTIRTLWQPAERFSLSERMSAATQAKAAGLPQGPIYTDVMQYAPDALPRLERARAEDLLYAPLVPAGPVQPTGSQPRTVEPAEIPA